MPDRQGSPPPLWRLARYASQVRLARALVDYMAGLDPSGVGVLDALVRLIPGHAKRGR